MQIFEICSKGKNNGEKHFSAVLFKIQPDSCLENLTGTKFNLNGITWIRKYCEQNLYSIVGRSVTVEFTNEERTEIGGHGDTGISDGIPVFDLATSIGHFTDAYITEMELDGEWCTVAVGCGVLDYMRYKPLIDTLEHRLSQGETIYGSIEIIGAPENDNKIIYLDGWKQEGRVPVDFIISGWAILDVLPSDNKSQILELNQKKNKEETKIMDETKIIEAVKSAIVETNSAKDELNEKITELNSVIETKDAEIKELNEKVEANATADADKDAKIAELQAKVDEMDKELQACKKNEMNSKLEAELNSFTDDEKKYAETEINDFKDAEVVTEVEINSIVNKINAEIGKAVKKAEADAKIAELNSAKNETKNVDIFSEVNSVEDKADDSDVSIF